jgi:hypothetical protein
MSPSRFVIAGLIAGLAASGCGGRSDPDETGGQAPACIWPVRFLTPSGTDLECRAARFFLVCFDSDGSPISCLSSSPTMCTDPRIAVDDECVSACGRHEYALECPIDDDPFSGQPGAYFSCLGVPPSPGPVVQSCCPCDARR